MSLTYAQFGPPRTLISNGRGFSVVPGDVDGDGDTDLVTCESDDFSTGSNGGYASNPHIVLYVNTDGLGTWQHVVLFSYEVGDIRMNDAQFVDVDMDGLVDVVARCPTDRHQWFKNLGSNTFSAHQDLLNVDNGAGPLFFTDDDGDGDLDVLSSDGFILRRYEALGNGEYGPSTAVTGIDDDYNDRFSLLDLDGDGDMDIARDFNGDYFLTLCNGDGTYTWLGQAHDLLQAGIFTFDVDGDGMEDILNHGNETGVVRWSRSLGNGEVEEPITLASFSQDPSFLVPIDVDGDGTRDILAVIENGIEFVRGLGPAQFSGVTTLIQYPAFGTTTDLTLAETDGDGQLELFVCKNILRQYLIPGDGTMRSGSVFSEDIYLNQLMRIVDLNGDGLLDIVRDQEQYGLVMVRTGLPEGGFTAPKIILEGAYDARHFEVLDLDADGDLDVVLYSDSIRFYRNQGDLTFEQFGGEIGFIFWDDHKFRCNDLDLDGDVDVVITDEDDGFFIARNENNETFTHVPVLPPLPDINCALLGFLDMDADEDMDIMIKTVNITALGWVENEGNGGDFFFGSDHNMLGTFPCNYSESVDVDGDGLLDLLMFNNSSSPTPDVFWRRNLDTVSLSSNGSFGSNEAIFTSDGWSFPFMRSTDVELDGDIDVVLLNNQEGKVLLNDGTGVFSEPQVFIGPGLGVSATDMNMMQDVDNDGDEDIVFYRGVAYSDSGRTSIMWMENFTTGPYMLSGSVFADLDGNGARGPDEPPLPGATINASPVGFIVQDGISGEYTAHCAIGPNLVSAAAPDSLWELSTTPASYSVELSEAEPAFDGLEFGFAPTEDISIITPEIVLSSAPCSDTTSLWVSLLNEGTRVEQGTLTLMLDPAFAYLNSDPAPLTVVGNTISWSFDSLMLGGMVAYRLDVVLPGAAQLGMSYMHTATANTVNDVGTSTGSFPATDNGVLACSYDPNDKQVSPLGYGTFGAVEIDVDHLEYTVRFQNTGNAPAVDLMIRDQLSSFLDRMSLRVLGASHQPSEVSIEPSGELVVRFVNIQLPDSGTNYSGSQGFIRFRFGLLPGLANLTEIRNTAEIYFDLNSAVVTNTVRTTLVDCALWEPAITNPANDVLEATEGDVYQWYFNGTPIPAADERWLLFVASGSYSVEVTSAYGCTALSDAIDIITLSVPNKVPSAMALAPNPFTHQTRLLFTQPITAANAVHLIDVHGRVVRSMVGNGCKELLISRGDLSGGLYVVRILSETGALLGSGRMVVE